MIYLDNAATSWPKPDAVGAAMASALVESGNPGRGAHGPALAAGRVLYQLRARAAALFNADPARVVATSGGTHGLNLAIAGLLKSGDHAITTDLEHNSVLRPLYAARANGVQLTIVGSSRGVVSPDTISDAVGPDTKLVAITHASNVFGTVQPIEAIAERCADKGIFLVVDAAQSAGHLRINLADLPHAAIALGGHKGLQGPSGTGLLLLSPGVEPAPLLIGGTGLDTFSESAPHALPERLEAGTPNIPGLAGLAAALGVLPDPHRALATTLQLRDRLLQTQLFTVPDTEPPGVPVFAGAVHTPAGRPLDPAQVADALAERDIAVRAGFHCAPLAHRAYAAHLQGLVRFSPSHLTSDADLDAVVAAVTEIAHA